VDSLFAASAFSLRCCLLAFVDGFMILGFSVIAGLLLMLLLRSPPAQSKPPESASGTT